VAAVAIGAATAQSVGAYPGLGNTVTFSAGCSTATAGQSCSVTACVTSSSGAPVANATVHFASNDQTIAKVVPSSANTGSNGCVAGAQLQTGPHCGTATLTATSGNASAQTQVKVTCSGGGGGGGGHGHNGGSQPAGGVQGTTAESQGGSGGVGGLGGSGGRGGSHGGPPLALVAGVPAGVALLVLLLVLLLRAGVIGGPPRLPSAGANELVPGLLIGSAPNASRRRRFRRAGVTRALDLRSESGPSDWGGGVAVERFPIHEGDAPPLESLDALLARVEEWLRDGETVLVHCTAGMGRAATVALALLVRRGHTLQDAHRLLRERRPQIAPSDRQLAALVAYEQRLRGDDALPAAETKPAA
jgi:hypothetical protein